MIKNNIQGKFVGNINVRRIIITLIFISTMSLIMTSCSSKEVRYVSGSDSEDYYIIDGETYTHYSSNKDPEKGNVLMSENKKSISLVSENGSTIIFDYCKNFWGTPIFSIDSENTFQNGSRFNVEATFKSKFNTGFGFSNNASATISMDTAGNYTMNGRYESVWVPGSFVEAGTYTVKDGIITLTGIRTVVCMVGLATSSPSEETETVEDTTTWCIQDGTVYADVYIKQ